MQIVYTVQPLDALQDVMCTHAHKHTYAVSQHKERRDRELFCIEEADFHAACWFTKEEKRLVSSSSWANNITSPAFIYMKCVCVQVCVCYVESGVSCCCSSSCSRKCRWQGNQRQRKRHKKQVKERSFR